MQHEDRIVREDERRTITGLGRTRWWQMEREHLAPKRIPLSSGADGSNSAVGWSYRELMTWVESRKATRLAA